MPTPTPTPTPPDRFQLVTPLFRQLEAVTTEDYLDLAGFLHNYHSLNTIQLYGRKIIPVDDFALHLVWKEDPAIHLLKALPGGLFDQQGALVGKWTELHLLERSLLYTYLHLIQGRRDLDIANDDDISLLPAVFHGDEGWKRWSELRRSLKEQEHVEPLNRKEIKRLAQDATLPNPFDGRILQPLSPPSSTSIHARYWYGDLRLSRLNLIALWWRMMLWLPWQKSKKDLAKRGHFFRTRHPVSSFWNGFGIYIVLIFAYLTTTLTAMQVALAVPPPDSSGDPTSNPRWFSDACKIFSYVVILAVAIQVPLVILYAFFVAIATWVGWRRKKQRNPALVQGKLMRIIRRDTEAGSKVDTKQAVLGAQQH